MMRRALALFAGLSLAAVVIHETSAGAAPAFRPSFDVDGLVTNEFAHFSLATPALTPRRTGS